MNSYTYVLSCVICVTDRPKKKIFPCLACTYLNNEIWFYEHFLCLFTSLR